MDTISSQILIVGAGLGGVAAAIRAASLGADVVLLEATYWVGGQLTAQGVCTPDENEWVELGGATSSYRQLRRELREYYRPMLRPQPAAEPHFNLGGCWVSGLATEPKVGHQVLLRMLESQPSIRLFPGMSAVAVERTGDTVDAVIAQDRMGAQTRFSASFILDATDTGELLPLAGMEYAQGAESAAETGEGFAPAEPHPEWIQPFTFPFALERRPAGEDHTIPKPAHYEELNTPFGQDYRVADGAITGVFTGSYPWWTYRRFMAGALFQDGRNDVAMINTGSNDYKGGIYPTGDPEADTVTLKLGRLASLGYVYWIQTECPRDDGSGHKGYPELMLRYDVFGTADGLSPLPYIRESRRIKAVKTVLADELLRCSQPGPRAAHFPDSCGIGHYHMDLHLGNTSERTPRGWPEMWPNTWPFQIPLGALVPVTVTNLLPACKNLGVTHLTNGSYRLHPIEWNVGESAGALAAFCLRNRLAPRQVRDDLALLEAYQRTLIASGIPIFWWGDVPAEHPAFEAAQWLGMWGILPGTGGVELQPDEPFTSADRHRVEQRAERTFTWPAGRLTRAQAALVIYEQLAAGKQSIGRE